MKFKTLFFCIFLFSAATTNHHCSPECQAALADLVTEVALQSSVTIISGEPFNIPNLIQNSLNTFQKCQDDIAETLGAGASKSRLKVDFDFTKNGSFLQNEINNNFSVPSIPAGQKAMQDYSLIFSEPGDYRVITFCDDKEDVAERDETNNDSAPKIVQAGKSSQPVKQALVIHVLPNPNFNKKPGQPNVEVLGYSVKIVK